MSQRLNEDNEIKLNLNQKRNSSTIVIGAMETVNKGNAGSNLDYLCNGINDAAQINAAISSLPEQGGKIILREGTYNISDTITIQDKQNVTIEGMGESTILKRNCLGNVILIQNSPHCSLSDFVIDGNSAEFSVDLHAVNVNSSLHAVVYRVHIKNDSVSGMSINHSDYASVLNCTIQDVDGNGIIIITADYAYIVFNTIINASNCGISIGRNSDR